MVKNMLTLAEASNDTEMWKFSDATAAVIFYATPHCGSPMMDALNISHIVAEAAGMLQVNPMLEVLELTRRNLALFTQTLRESTT